MEKYRSYRGRRRRSRSGGFPYAKRADEIARRQAVRLAVCFVLLVAAVLLKFVFPDALRAIGEKISATVNYKQALATLGEGLSGERKFTEAVSEAFTYAFSTKPVPEGEITPVENEESAVPAMADAGAGQSRGDEPASGAGGDTENAANTELTDAIMAAFLQSQEAYSDYAIPAGVTYEMPRIPFEYQKPLEGVVTSSFGFRMGPGDDAVRFHYGTDIASDEGAVVRSFADGRVIAVGDSPTMGKFAVVSHGSVETQYGHLSAVYVSEGQAVTMGQRVGAVGSTGNATSPCLHFELKVSGLNVNPEFYLRWS
jgi:murein DD-endopeptidase MepM/ murein hydrolase activator NlpD